jgi:DEAD/DEAH box helicase domain-containing protein
MSAENLSVPRGKPKRKSDALDTPAKRRPKNALKSNDESGSTQATLDPSDFTLEFRQLDQVFRSLNTVYTFCCTRKHLPTTFENLKSSVENLTKRFNYHKLGLLTSIVDPYQSRT